MKSLMASCLSIILCLYMSFIPPFEHFDLSASNTSEEQVLTTCDYFTSSDAVTVIAPTIVQKGFGKVLFHIPILFLDFKDTMPPLNYSYHNEHSSNTISFLYMVMFHSNYLS
ncbi:hypothetical protein [Bacillus sp. Marseille-Q3570]|uniref:hypothetical protein n=1 Tax=Bacillus sp. Marseille-Q3570 TaxID=2963522 RepID=UPI0021B7249D|nr:hypothetical protein [Bacillus sp. Marseille-Q3570]